MLTGCYSIEELAEESGFDKRVIRSFIEQGLLCGPDSKGRYARYTHAHLIRLKAIKQLRDCRHMSLGEIRAAFLSMTEEDIHAMSTRSAGVNLKGTELRSSVLDYLRTARHQPAALPVQDNDDFSIEKVTAGVSGNNGHGLSALERLLNVLQEDAGIKRSVSQGKAQSWHCFAVTPDIELSVRGLQDGGQIEQWERIADCLREILLGGSKNEQQ